MEDAQPFNAPVIVNPQGKPARKAVETVCSRCGAGPEKRKPSSGFGIPHPVCECGYEWHDEVFRG